MELDYASKVIFLLSEYTNLSSYLLNIYLAPISVGCKILKAFTDDWDKDKVIKEIESLLSTLKSLKSGWRDKNKQNQLHQNNTNSHISQ